MEDLKIQQNLEENIKMIFKKIIEEGSKGTGVCSNCYPVEVQIAIEIMHAHSYIAKTFENKTIIKDYRDYMKLIQTLDTLINMYNRLNIKDFKESDKIKTMIEEQIEIIQNTGLKSLNKGYISQYSCLIKCYDMLLRMSKQFVDIENNNRRINNLPQYKVSNITLTDDKDKVDDFINKMKDYTKSLGLS